MKSLERHVGQIAEGLANRPQGTFPCNTEKNPREQAQAVVLRNDKELQNPEKKMEESDGVPEKSQEETPKEQGVSNPLHVSPPKEYVLPVPFPQRHRKNTLDKQFYKFLDVFKKLQINIPFADALEQMPSYAKFMKEILSKKRKLGEHETVMLTEECTALLQQKLPQKLKDPGSFTIPCTIGKLDFNRALCDLGASINLMPLSIFKKLGLGEVKSTTISLQLADGSIIYPKGIIEDVLVKVDKFIFPADFVVLDMEEDRDIPLLLGRPFLATGRTLIDVEQGKIILRVGEEQVTFNMFKTMGYPTNQESRSSINTENQLVEKNFNTELKTNEPLELYLPDTGSFKEANREVPWVRSHWKEPFKQRMHEPVMRKERLEANSNEVIDRKQLAKRRTTWKFRKPPD